MPSLTPSTTTTTTSETSQYGEPGPNITTLKPVGEDSSSNLLVDRYFLTMLSHVGCAESLSTQYTYTSTSPIGRGLSTIVYRGQSLSDSSVPVAIKHTALPSKSDAVDWFAKYLTLRDCHFYTHFEAFYLTASKTGIIVMDLFGDALTNVSSMDERDIKSMARDVTRQLATLQRQTQCCHLDVKPANIMRRADGRWSLIDFDFATRIGTECKGYLGTREWSAPEMRPDDDDEEVCNEVSASQDMWSLGLCVLYALCGGQQPMMRKRSSRKVKREESLKAIRKWYARRVSGQQSQSAVEQWLSVQLVQGVLTGEAFDFVFQCLRFDADKRMTPQKALLHKWLR